MISKGLHKFESRIGYFSVDLELVNVINNNIDKFKGDEVIFSGVTKSAHPKLYSHANTNHARKLVICHLRKTIYVSYIKEIYEEVAQYIKYILYHGAKTSLNLRRLIGEHNKSHFDALTILSAQSYDKIVHTVIEQIFQQLENERSTIDLIKKTIKKLDLDVDNDIIEQAIPYLEIRHIYVHADGVPNQDFKDKYPDITIDRKGRIGLSREFLQKTKTKITNLLRKIDESMITKGFLPAGEYFRPN
jgi:hypothetical protein